MNVVVIPARLSSTRLPNKLLLPVLGKPLIWHTIQRTLESEKINKIVIATEDKEILNVVRSFRIDKVYCMLTDLADSGTERIASISGILADQGYTRIVNFQGDEPMLPGRNIDLLLSEKTNDLVTLAAPMTSLEFNSNSVVKVVLDFNNYAMCFSRSCIPYNDYKQSLKHLGLYSYPIDFLLNYDKIKETTYQSEKLEQIAWLQSGYKIKVVISEDAHFALGIDTKEEYDEFVKRASKQDTI